MARGSTIALAVLSSVLLVAPIRADAPQEQPKASLGILVAPTPPNAEHQGVVVREVPSDSPAAKAGMKTGDIIVKIGDKEITDFDVLVNTLANHKPGDKVSFQVLRNGKEKTVTVTLGKRPARSPEENPPNRRRPTAFLGIETRPPRPGARAGVVVAEVVPNTPAAKAGIESGDVITQVDGQTISGPADLREAVRKAGAGKKITIKIRRGDQTKEVTATLEETPADIGFEFPQFPGPRPVVPGMSDQRIRQLERQVQALQKRVDELERKLAQKAGKE